MNKDKETKILPSPPPISKLKLSRTYVITAPPSTPSGIATVVKEGSRCSFGTKG